MKEQKQYCLFYVNCRGFRVFLTKWGSWICETKLRWGSVKRYVNYELAEERMIKLNERPHSELVALMTVNV